MFTVIWRTSALDELADYYVTLDLPEQRRLDRDLESFNRQLSNDPTNIGESRAGSLRVAFVNVFVVRFEVNLIDQVVRVRSLKRTSS
jgi:plasmid stabilization system protein ParE